MPEEEDQLMSSQSSSEAKKKSKLPVTHTRANASKASFASGIEFDGKKMMPMQLLETEGSDRHKKKKDKKKKKLKKQKKRDKKAKRKASQN